MVMTLVGYRAVMAELHLDALPREARTARKVRVARKVRTARRQKGV